MDLSSVFYEVPRAAAALAGLERTQAFLLRPSLQTSRGALPRSGSSMASWNTTSGQLKDSGPSIVVKQLSVGYIQPILDGIDLQVATGLFTIVSGPTGCGKWTLVRAILGEVVPTGGVISLSTHSIEYCSQRPWLPNGTIRDVICGAAETYDEAWYDEVTGICCLNRDFGSLSCGDQTQIGSRGLNLSGGQRQRVGSSLVGYH